MKFERCILVLSVILATGCASKKVDVDKVGDLRESKQMIEMAKDEGASRYAPHALKTAEDSLDHAARVMYENKDMKVVENQNAAAKNEAKRALLMTRESKHFASMNSEEVAAWAETKLRGLQGMAGVNGTFEPFNKQYMDLQGSVQNSAKLGAKANSLQEQTAQLEKSKQLNDRYEEVRRNFTDEEAEILREGNNLIVRLKAVEFPRGKAEIKPENFVLLTKVQKTIKAFGEPDVTIEGHTDSTGNAKKNETLSLQRAENVKAYLVANAALPEDKISVEGMGAAKPVAPNNTEEGRASNRRIDVIISPSQQAE